MRKNVIICFTLVLLSLTSVSAQGILDKIDKTLDKTDKATGQADRTNRTLDKVTGLFKKKKKNKDTEFEGTQTTILLNGITFAALKSLNTNIEKDNGKGSTKMKYKASGSKIVVYHEGTTEDLLKILEKISPAIFSEKNIESLDENEIIVKVK